MGQSALELSEITGKERAVAQQIGADQFCRSRLIDRPATQLGDQACRRARGARDQRDDRQMSGCSLPVGTAPLSSGSSLPWAWPKLSTRAPMGKRRCPRRSVPTELAQSLDGPERPPDAAKSLFAI